MGDKTLEYYNVNAEKFVESTCTVDFFHKVRFWEPNEIAVMYTNIVITAVPLL